MEPADTAEPADPSARILPICKQASLMGRLIIVNHKKWVLQKYPVNACGVRGGLCGDMLASSRRILVPRPPNPKLLPMPLNKIYMIPHFPLIKTAYNHNLLKNQRVPHKKS